MNFSRIALVLSLLIVPVLRAQDGKPDAGPNAAAPKFPLPLRLPPDAHVAQTVQLDGKTLKYTAVVGALPVKNVEDKATGEVVFTSYVVDGPDRPVTFAFNGGPGAAGLFEPGGNRTETCGIWGGGPSDPAVLDGPYLAGFYGPGVYRSD